MRALTLLLLLPLTASAVPMQLDHQGRLFDASGLPLDGDIDLRLSLWDAEVGGTELWSETSTVPFDDGYFSVSLGQSSPLDDSIFDGSTRFLELDVVGGAAPLGRIGVVSVPYAIRAQTATTLDGTIEWAQISDAPDPSDHQHDAADLSTGTIDLLRLPVGTGSNELASGDHLHNLGDLTGSLLPGALPTHSHDAADLGSLPDHGHDAADLGSLPDHGHDAADLGSLPTHSHGAADLSALPAHTHDVADLTGGPLAIGMLPVGTTGTTVAAGDHAHAFADLTGELQVPDSTATCTAGLAGTLRWSNDQLQICASSGWSVLFDDDLGSAADRPGQSCLDILTNVPSAPDGVYWIDPNGASTSDAYEAYCDMTTDGGGWTRVADVGTSNLTINGSSYINGIGNLGDANYIAPCGDFQALDTHPDVRVNMGTVKDFFTPIGGSDLCGMLTSFTNHLWGQSPGNYVDPPNYSTHLGGSQSGWPASNVAGDARTYLSFWGGYGANSGCCNTTTAGGETAAWGRTFEMYVRE